MLFIHLFINCVTLTKKYIKYQFNTKYLNFMLFKY